MGASDWPVLGGKDASIMKFALIHSNEAKQLMRHANASKTKLTPWNTLEPFLRATIELSDLITAGPTMQTVMDEVKRVSINQINFQNASQQAQNSMAQDIMLIKHAIETPRKNTPATTTGWQRAESWAQRAARSAELPPSIQTTSTHGNTSSSTAPTEKEREIIIKLRDNGCISQWRNRSNNDLKARLNEAIAKSRNSTITARKLVAAKMLKSGDVQGHAANAEDAAALKENCEWIKTLGVHAEVANTTYGVIVHGIPTNSINTEEPGAMAQRIAASNSSVLGTFNPEQITHIGWLTKESTKKRHASLVVEFKTPTLANRAIHMGFLWESTTHKAVLYDRSCRIKQCYKCFKYGHIGPQCSATSQICGFCAGNHVTKECPSKETRICAVCKGAHTAWSSSCSFRKKELSRVEEAKASRRQYWPEIAKSNHRYDGPPVATLTQTHTSATTTGSTMILEEEATPHPRSTSQTADSIAKQNTGTQNATAKPTQLPTLAPRPVNLNFQDTHVPGFSGTPIATSEKPWTRVTSTRGRQIRSPTSMGPIPAMPNPIRGSKRQRMMSPDKSLQSSMTATTSTRHPLTEADSNAQVRTRPAKPANTRTSSLEGSENLIQDQPMNDTSSHEQGSTISISSQ